MCDEIKPARTRFEATNDMFMGILRGADAESPSDKIFIEVLQEFIPPVLARVIDGSSTEDATPTDTIIGLLQAFATCAALLLHCVKDEDGVREKLAEAFITSFIVRIRSKEDVAEQSDSEDGSDASVSSEPNPSA
jgi:hypothetical protein